MGKGEAPAGGVIEHFDLILLGRGISRLGTDLLARPDASSAAAAAAAFLASIVKLFVHGKGAHKVINFAFR